MAVEYTNAKELIAVKGYYGKDGKIDMCEALTALIKDVIALAECEQELVEEVREGL